MHKRAERTLLVKLEFHGSSLKTAPVEFKLYVRQFPRSILVQHVRHALFPRDMLATSL